MQSTSGFHRNPRRWIIQRALDSGDNLMLCKSRWTFMIRRFILVLLALAFSACSSLPSPEKKGQVLYLATQEEPDNRFGYQVYLLFLDDDHFTWWRTKEARQVVLQRLNYYLNEHPGTGIYTKYKTQENRLTGSREIVTRGQKDIRDHVFVQNFKGIFEREQLIITMDEWYEHDDGSRTEPIRTIWKMLPVQRDLQLITPAYTPQAVRR